MIKTKKQLREENYWYEKQNSQLFNDLEDVTGEMDDAVEEIIKLKEEVAYLNGLLEGSGASGNPAAGLPSEGVLKRKGFSVAMGADMKVTDVDDMCKAVDKQIDWCEEQGITVSEGGNVEKN